jgi:hypothetical protein
MKRTVTMLLSLALLLTSCSLFTVNGSEQSGGENISNNSQENSSRIENVVFEEILVDPRLNTLEERQALFVDNFNHANCNVLKVFVVERPDIPEDHGMLIDENEITVFETEDGTRLFITEGAFTRLYNKVGHYGILKAYTVNIGDINYIYYYGEIPEDGNLANANIKSIIREAVVIGDFYEHYGLEFIEQMDLEMQRLANSTDTTVMSFDEAVFQLFESDLMKQALFEAGISLDDTIIVKKITISTGEYYYAIGDMYIIPRYIDRAYTMSEGPVTLYSITYCFTLQYPSEENMILECVASVTSYSEASLWSFNSISNESAEFQYLF